MSTTEKLYPGDRVAFGDNECEIIVDSVAKDQALEADGIIIFTDQYGELKLAEFDGDHWEIVNDSFLTDEQAEKLAAVRA